MSTLKIQAVGDNIIVKRLNAARQSLIQLPDSTIQKQFYGIITSVGDKVNESYLQPDIVCFIDPHSPRARSEYKGFYFFKKSDIIVVKNQSAYRPLGNKVLLKRLNVETKVGSIIIPENHDSTDQSLFGVVSFKGIKNGVVIDCPFDAGDTVKIENWSINIQEIDINGDYYLSVPVKELAYVERN